MGIFIVRATRVVYGTFEVNDADSPQEAVSRMSSSGVLVSEESGQWTAVVDDVEEAVPWIERCV